VYAKYNGNPLGTAHTQCRIRLDQIRLKEPLCLSALEGSHFKMKNGPRGFDKWGFVTSIGPHYMLGWSVGHKEWRGMWTRALYHFYLSSGRPSATMINCQERVCCQLASDLCALYPNHLLRGERSCLSDYDGLYTHLCHGKGKLPCCSLYLDIAPAWGPFAICVYHAVIVW